MENFKDAKILIVDDQKHNRDLVKFFLQQIGLCNFLEAESAIEAVELSLRHIPDLIFLDINLGDDSGFNVCKILKETDESKDIPIIFLSSYSETENRTKGYKIGAVDFVSKPINHYEIIARTKVHLKNGQLLKQLQEYQNRTSQELEKAKKTQNATLPSPMEIELLEYKNKIKIESVFNSSSELAGDYWKVIQLDRDHIAVILTDFSGHGVYSALNTVRMDLLIAKATKDILKDPKIATKYLNKELYKILPKEDFCSIIYLVLNTKTGIVEYTGANTPDLYVLKSDGSIPIKYTAKGFPLAFSKNIVNADFTYNKFELEKGDSLLIYSDALLEEIHQDGSRWLDKKLQKVLQEAQKEIPQDKFVYILESFNSTVKRPLKDDLTMVCITREDKKRAY